MSRRRIIAPMGNPQFPGWTDWLWYTRRQEFGYPHLRVEFVHVYVRDQVQSRKFFVEQLGFELAAEIPFPSGERFVVVAPPHGSALLALVEAPAGPAGAERVGRLSEVTFLTEDLGELFRKWSARQVRFHGLPARTRWGGLQTSFEDIDGNRFNLIEISQAAKALEAERRAVEEQKEAERHAAYEMGIAKEVQSKLFPQRQPPLETLSYAGACIQARAVGGDYYDYLDLGRGRLGLVVGDVAGKGIAAALLMANLQANLRSQYALALDDLERLLQSVNRMFYENTVQENYATLVFAEYEDASRRLRYVNCGHLAPLLLRRDKTLTRLQATSTVLGMFKEWECSMAEVELSPGDALLFYTDGVPDALSDDGEEFGEQRLEELFRAQGHLEAPEMLRALIESVQAFSGREQEDDITLVIARCRDAP